MNLEVKICGLKTSEMISTAIEQGANYIGFIFFEKSPRHLTIEQAKKLRLLVQKPVHLVAVSVDADNATLDDIVKHVKPDFLQLHGHETPMRVNEIKQRYHLPIIKAFSIREKSDFDIVAHYKNIADKFLFDAKAPKGSQLPGGNGVSFDWSLLNMLDEKHKTMLSGGLNAENIAQALAIAKPAAIDISSGVESTPGIKDKKLIEVFFAAVKKAIET